MKIKTVSKKKSRVININKVKKEKDKNGNNRYNSKTSFGNYKNQL